MERFMWIVLLLSCLWSGSGAGEEGTVRVGQRMVFPATTGASVSCPLVDLPPATSIAWLDGDYRPLPSLSQRWRILQNGTLLVLPTMQAGDSLPTSLRCRVSTPKGSLLSPPVFLVPVWTTEPSHIEASPAQSGGVAVLHCLPPASSTPAPLGPTRWWRDNQLIDLSPRNPNSESIGAGRWDEWLLVDGGTPVEKYSCQIEGSSRSQAISINITEDPPSETPRLILNGGEIDVPVGADVCLPCAASDHPPPHYTWYHETGGLSQASLVGAWTWRGGAALCFPRAQSSAAGAWSCRASTARGDVTSRVTLNMRRPLTVSLNPALSVARGGSTVRLDCQVSDPAATISWFHMGTPLTSSSDVTVLSGGASLLMRATAQTQGVWQCEAKRATDVIIATAEIKLAEAAPELRDRFIEQTLRPGARVMLRCVASAAPPARFVWIRDLQLLDSSHISHRYSIGEETIGEGETISTMNISIAAVEDGGRYTCRAHNRVGEVEHSARLNIFGPPIVRPIATQRVIAGETYTLFCPYAGYPISTISWKRNGQTIGVEGRMRVQNSALVISPTLRSDSGRYTCTVTAPTGETASQDMLLQIFTAPQISPFMFSPDLTAGSAVRVLCSVSAGDRPFKFAWLKDGAPFQPHLQIQENSVEDFSLLKFSEVTEQHEGNYTCRVSNHAATTDYTATLRVKVPPSWTREPQDIAVAVGRSLLIICEARGRPPPSIIWHRKSCLPPSSCDWSLLSTNGTMIMNTATKDFRGLYRCTADNGVGPPLLKHINVTVYEPAVVESPSETLNVTCIRDSTAPCRLSCTARGDGPLAISWRHERIPVDLHSGRIAISEERGTGGSLRSELTLRTVTSADAGEYKCRAHNAHAHSDRLLVLYVEEPPSAPEGLRIWARDTSTVRLSWKGSPSLPHAAQITPLRSPEPPELKDLRVDLTSEPRCEEDWVCGTLSGLKPGAAYSVRVRASSRAGPSPLSSPLIFTTLDDAPSEPPQNIRVTGDDNGELLVSWSPPSRESWHGDLVGHVVQWRAVAGQARGSEGRAVRRAGATVALRGLPARTQYRVTVRAFNRAGAGPPSQPVLALTTDGEPQAPINVRCGSSSSREVRVQWDPDSTHREYEILYAPAFSGRAYWTEEEEQNWSGTRVSSSGMAGEARISSRAGGKVWARAREGVATPPVVCDMPSSVTPSPVVEIQGAAISATAIRLWWKSPEDHNAVTHYTLHARDILDMSNEWIQRMEALPLSPLPGDTGSDEVSRVLVGLRPRSRYQVWVRAHSAAGVSTPSIYILIHTPEPGYQVSAKIWSFPRKVCVAVGSRVRVRCAADGTPPLRRRWAPLPPRQAVSDGDLDLLGVQPQWTNNYTCWVANAAGSDSVTHTIRTRPAPEPPPALAPLRIVRANQYELHVAWERVGVAFPVVLGYTVEWTRLTKDSPTTLKEGVVGSMADATGVVIGGLECGTQYSVRVRAHNVVGPSHPSEDVLTSTLGYDPVPPSAEDFIWMNSTAMRLSLLAWDTPCPLLGWRVALRPCPTKLSPSVGWTELQPPSSNDLVVEVGDLQSGSWYEVRVTALASEETAVKAMYRVPTLTEHGERLGNSERVAIETRAPAGTLPSSTLPALAAGALGTLLVVIAFLARRLLWPRKGQEANNRRIALPPPDDSLPSIRTLDYTETTKDQLSGTICSQGLRTWSGRSRASGDSASDSSGECVACRRAALPAPPPLPTPRKSRPTTKPWQP